MTLPHISDLYSNDDVVALFLNNGQIVQIERGSFEDLEAKDDREAIVNVYRAKSPGDNAIIVGLFDSIIALVCEPSDSE